MEQRQRRLLVWMTALAAVCVAAQAVTGFAELALFLTPVFIVVTLLVSGRYVGEERIARRWSTVAPPAPRRVRPRWRPVAQALVPAFALGAPRSRRGPPAGALLAA